MKIFRFLSLASIVILLYTMNVFAGEKVYFYHTDPAGTPLAMTDSSGNVVWKADYRPFGEEQNINPQTRENDMRFVGKEKDKETGLQYFGARYMKDEIGRFISPDPVGPVDPRRSKTNYKMLENPQMLNRYVYSLNNPYRYLDPNGREVYFIGVGTSFFVGNIGPNARKDQRGYGTQASFGIAYDTKSKEFIVFTSGGSANQTEDKVIGFNAGIGPFGGRFEGDMKDFKGEFREKSRTVVVTVTSMESDTGKEGTSIAIGGKGFGFSYTSITTKTYDLGGRLREMLSPKKEKSED